MRNWMMMTAVLWAMVVTAPCDAQLSKGEVVFSGTNWKVLRTKDAMTDKISCTGVWRDEYRVQLGSDALYISRTGLGGVDGYRIRVDAAVAASAGGGPSVELPGLEDIERMSKCLAGSGEPRSMWSAHTLGDRLQEDAGAIIGLRETFGCACPVPLQLRLASCA